MRFMHSYAFCTKVRALMMRIGATVDPLSHARGSLVQRALEYGTNYLLIRVRGVSLVRRSSAHKTDYLLIRV